MIDHQLCHRHSIFHTSIIVLEVSASPMMPICPARPTAGRSWGSNSNTSGSGVFSGFVEVDGVENLVDIQHDSEMSSKQSSLAMQTRICWRLLKWMYLFLSPRTSNDLRNWRKRSCKMVQGTFFGCPDFRLQLPNFWGVATGRTVKHGTVLTPGGVMYCHVIRVICSWGEPSLINWWSMT